MTRITRPTKTQKYEAVKQRRNFRKPDFVTPIGGWKLFCDVVKLCTLANLKVHADALNHWELQCTSPGKRKVKLVDERCVLLQSIVSGHTSGIARTEEQKASTRALRSSTRKAKEYGQLNFVEAAGIKVFMTELNKRYPGQFECRSLPDGLAADIIIRRVTAAVENVDQWCAVQVKCARVHDGEPTSFNFSQKDGAFGGRYTDMVILAIGVDSSLKRPTAEAGFDAVADAEIKELLVFQNASQMPGKCLQPYPRRTNTRGFDYGDNRYTKGFDRSDQLAATLQLSADYIDNAPKYTREQVWFGTHLNHSVMKENHWQEVMNCKTLAQIVGFENLSAPLAQNECVDTIALVDGIQVNISLKTATLDKKGFRFELKKAPNAQFCKVVLVFYIDRATEERTHVSVLCAKEVYNNKTKEFNWSPTNRPHILASRISLSNPTTASTQLHAGVQQVMSTKRA